MYVISVYQDGVLRISDLNSYTGVSVKYAPHTTLVTDQSHAMREKKFVHYEQFKEYRTATGVDTKFERIK